MRIEEVIQDTPENNRLKKKRNPSVGKGKEIVERKISESDSDDRSKRGEESKLTFD